MKPLLRPIFAMTIAASLLVMASVPSEAARQARGRSSYDGRWSVVINTTRGDCGSVRAALQIMGGRVYSQDPSYQAYGAVGSGGAIRVTIVSGARSRPETRPACSWDRTGLGLER